MSHYYLVWETQRDGSLKMVCKRHVTVEKMADLLRLEFRGCCLSQVSKAVYDAAYTGMRPPKN
jgi:hypothetical protein